MILRTRLATQNKGVVMSTRKSGRTKLYIRETKEGVTR